MWLEAVKMYGNSPRKLFVTMKINKAMNIIDLPFKDVGPNKVLNSKYNLFIIILIVKEILLGITQNIGVTTIKNKSVLIQFRE